MCFNYKINILVILNEIIYVYVYIYIYSIYIYVLIIILKYFFVY